LQKTALSIAASIALLAILASPALALPTASFTVNPAPPVSGVSATYTSTSTADPLFEVAEVDWDFDNDGDFEVKDTTAPFTAAHTYANAGTKTFQMKVIDNNALAPAVTTAPKTVTVVTRRPTADFDFNPASPFVGDDVLFASDASDPDGDALKYSWDFGDDSPRSTAHDPVHQFTSAGTKTVTLTVTDPFDASYTVSHEVDVRGVLVPGNSLPIARFAFSPRTAQVGDSVEFISSSFDAEGELKEQTWDLDGDGEFDDARGDDVLYTFTSSGVKTVRLRATDSAGASAVSQRQLTVKPVPTPPPGFLRPEPKVRLNGLIFTEGTRIQILGVRAPRGALVTVRCKGKSCPVKERRKRIKKGPVRFRTFERFMRGGVRLEIFVTKKGKIGDYTRYTIRRGKSPLRMDRCVTGSRLRPVKCR
jgi:PKD repeat protein